MIWFPIGDDSHKGHTPYVSRTILVICVIVFIYQLLLPTNLHNAFVYKFATIPQLITQGTFLHTLVTSAFLHGGRSHLLWNMLFLRVFADNIESHIGSLKFTWFYIAGAIAANFAHIAFNLWSVTPALWASGAISAVLWAYLIRFPHSNIRVRSLQLMRSLYVPAQQFLRYWIWFQVLMTMAGGGSGVAWRAHIGWFAFGVVRAKYFRPY